MNDTKHTPGPWDYDCDSGGCYFKLSAGEEAIIHCCDFCSTPTINTEANARLIAAAPELLEALKDAPVPSKYHGIRGFETNRFLSDYEAWMKNRRAAIAKAKGGQP